MRWTQLALLALCCLMQARGDQTVMKDVTLGFGQALEKCREESGLTDEKMEEFFHFWHDDFKFVHRELGCAILCMSRHFNLLTETSRMHHENTDNFIKSFPNGEILAAKMVEIIHTCELRFENEADHCARILRIAECFRDTCKSVDLAPTMEILIAEFILQAESGKR
uniref:General odorant-binding protein 1 n=1 Tax=Dendrolimus tabulaeformis TaxID=416556 RepID=A0A059PCQ9_9NEOP|nr:general odorant-binding protein 1 [Dendrolimus tabulaeformis]